VELQGRHAELTASGIGAAAISYDSPEVLADFAERRITFPLVSDEGSETVTAFGILGTPFLASPQLSWPL
jgi:peroxiredoxin